MKKINVTIWNEYCHEKLSESVAKVYPKGIHGAIEEKLSEFGKFNIRCATFDMKDHGLSDEVLNNTDVLIWWGHMKHNEVSDEIAQKIKDRVLNGMGFIALHSAHGSKPFKLLMGTPCSLGWRENGDREYVWVCDPSHPIAEGIDRYIKLEHEETYAEPFSIPEPDKLIFIGSYEGGEVLRAGCCYRRGYGKIFYFQPGHETFPTYHNPQIIRVIKNAIHWAYNDYRKEIDCPNIKKIEE